MGDALKRDTGLRCIYRTGRREVGGDFGLVVREKEQEGFSHVATERQLK